MRNAASTTSHVASAISPTGQAAASMIPSAVATPLPPLNPSQMGNRWPRKAAPPASAPAVSPHRARATSTARAPLAGVADQGDGGKVLASGAKDIGGSDVAGADRAHVARAAQPRRQHTEGHGAQQVAAGHAHYDDESGQACEHR